MNELASRPDHNFEPLTILYDRFQNQTPKCNIEGAVNYFPPNPPKRTIRGVSNDNDHVAIYWFFIVLQDAMFAIIISCIDCSKSKSSVYLE